VRLPVEGVDGSAMDLYSAVRNCQANAETARFSLTGGIDTIKGPKDRL
jgi:hypothetical protein